MKKLIALLITYFFMTNVYAAKATSSVSCEVYRAYTTSELIDEKENLSNDEVMDVKLVESYDSKGKVLDIIL